MNPLISIIMPVYNRETSVAYSIESVLNQSYSNLELIIIDDASTDDTSDILEFYKKEDNRVVIVTNRKNSRLSEEEWEPRNDGIKIAKGQYFAYLDSDNLWHKDFLKIMLDHIKDDENLKLITCNSRNHYFNEGQYKKIIKEDNRAIINNDALNLSVSFVANKVGLGIAGIDWYIDTNEIMHRSNVFEDLKDMWRVAHPNREVINKSQVINASYRRHNDQDLVERIINHYGIGSIKQIDQVLVDYFYSHNQNKYQKVRNIYYKDKDI